MNMLDGVVVTLLAICVAVWPTQVVSDGANRWLRIVAIVAAALHAILEWRRLPFVPAYLVAVLFALLLVRDRKRDEPSSVRESRAGAGEKRARWILILGCAAALVVTVALCLLTPRAA